MSVKDKFYEGIIDVEIPTNDEVLAASELSNDYNINLTLPRQDDAFLSGIAVDSVAYGVTLAPTNKATLMNAFQEQFEQSVESSTKGLFKGRKIEAEKERLEVCLEEAVLNNCEMYAFVEKPKNADEGFKVHLTFDFKDSDKQESFAFPVTDETISKAFQEVISRYEQERSVKSEYLKTIGFNDRKSSFIYAERFNEYFESLRGTQDVVQRNHPKFVDLYQEYELELQAAQKNGFEGEYKGFLTALAKEQRLMENLTLIGFDKKKTTAFEFTKAEYKEDGVIKGYVDENGKQVPFKNILEQYRWECEQAGKAGEEAYAKWSDSIRAMTLECVFPQKLNHHEAYTEPSAEDKARAANAKDITPSVETAEMVQNTNFAPTFTANNIIIDPTNIKIGEDARVNVNSITKAVVDEIMRRIQMVDVNVEAIQDELVITGGSQDTTLNAFEAGDEGFSTPIPIPMTAEEKHDLTNSYGMACFEQSGQEIVACNKAYEPAPDEPVYEAKFTASPFTNTVEGGSVQTFYNSFGFDGSCSISFNEANSEMFTELVERLGDDVHINYSDIVAKATENGVSLYVMGWDSEDLNRNQSSCKMFEIPLTDAERSNFTQTYKEFRGEKEAPAQEFSEQTVAPENPDEVIEEDDMDSKNGDDGLGMD